MVPPSSGPPPASKSSIGGWIHGGLDLVGLVPVVGEPADGLNGVYYALEGDKLNAGLSLAAMIPIAGDAATGGKLVKKTAKLTADAEHSARGCRGGQRRCPVRASAGRRCSWCRTRD